MPTRVETRQPALPGMTTAAGNGRRRSADVWSPDERQFAAACRAAWNRAFAGGKGTRAYQTRHNEWLAIKLYRWLHSDSNDGAPPMTEGDVLVAIECYSRDEWITTKCGGRFRDYRSWMTDAPDSVERALTAAGKQRGAGKPASGSAKRRQAAESLSQHKGLHLLVAACRRDNDSVRNFVAWRERREKHHTVKDGRTWTPAWRAMLDAFDALDQQQRLALRERAARAFEALHGRPATSDDDHEILALALAIHDREREKATTDARR